MQNDRLKGRIRRRKGRRRYQRDRKKRRSIEQKHNNKRKERKIKKIISGILMALIESILTVAIMFFIRQYAPGNMEGSRLEAFLQQQICDVLGAKNINIQNFKCVYNNPYDPSGKLVLVTYGEYISEGNNFGRVITLFERRKKSLFEEIIGCESRYEISFIRNIDIGKYNNQLYYVDCTVEDIDADGSMEVIMTLTSNYATRISNALVIMSKKDQEWRLISPSKDYMLNIEKNADYNDGMALFFDIYEFSNPLDSCRESVIGLSHNGMVYFVKNPLHGGIDICYKIGANDKGIGYAYHTYYAYVMMRYKDNKLYKEDNWNQGKILYLSDDEDEDISSYWGYYRIGDMMFYTSDD